MSTATRTRPAVYADPHATIAALQEHFRKPVPPKLWLPPIAEHEPLIFIDYFAGAGGTSNALVQTARALRRPYKLFMVNHSAKAVETQRLNFPGAISINCTVENISLPELIGGTRATLFSGSAECIMYSGARPKDLPILDQSRSGAVYILEGVESVYCDTLFIENVPEWVKWGRLDRKTLRPEKQYEGELFDAFCNRLKKIGYELSFEIDNSADFGAPTSRKRLIMLGRRDGLPLVRGCKTHAKNPVRGDGKKKWATARSIINFDLRGKSIFHRLDPHSAKTVLRQRAGFSRQEAMLAPAYVSAIDAFLPLSQAFAGALAISGINESDDDVDATDFVEFVAYDAATKQQKRRDARRRTIEQTTEALAAANPTSVPQTRALELARNLMAFVQTKRMTRNELRVWMRHAVLDVFGSGVVHEFDGVEADQLLLNLEQQGAYSFTVANRTHAAPNAPSDPLANITTAPGGGIAHVAPMILGQHGGAIARDIDELPINTIAAGGAIALIDTDEAEIYPKPTLLKMNVGTSSTYNDELRDIDRPITGLVAKTCIGIETASVPEPFLFRNRFDGGAKLVDEAQISGIVGTKNIVLAESVAAPFTFANRFDNNPRSLDESAQSIVGNKGGGGLHFVEPTLTGPTPFAVAVNHGASSAGDTRVTNLDGVLPTITPRLGTGLVTTTVAETAAPAKTNAEPFRISYFGRVGEQRTATLDEAPFPTFTASPTNGFVEPTDPEPFLLPQNNFGSETTRETKLLLPCVSSIPRIGLTTTDTGGDAPPPMPETVELSVSLNPETHAFLIANFGERTTQTPRTLDPKTMPVWTITSRGAGTLVVPGIDEDAPIHPIVRVKQFYFRIDVLFRMLTVRELASAMGFPKWFKFSGSDQDATRQIGNAVEYRVAYAHTLELLRRYARKSNARTFREQKKAA